MQEVTEDIEEMAELLKALSHPVRLCIVRGLFEHSCNVSRIKDCMSLPQSTVSKHVGILREKGIIKGYRNGSEVIYKLVNEDVKKIVTVLMGKMTEVKSSKGRTEN